eukprot:403361158
MNNISGISHKRHSSLNNQLEKQTVFQHVVSLAGDYNQKNNERSFIQSQNQNFMNSSSIKQNDLGENELERSFKVSAIKVENQLPLEGITHKKKSGSKAIFFQDRYKRDGQQKYMPESSKTVMSYQDQLKNFKDYVEKMCKSNFQTIKLGKKELLLPQNSSQIQLEEERKKNDSVIKSMRMAEQKQKLLNLLKQNNQPSLISQDIISQQQGRARTGKDDKLSRSLKCEGQQIRLDHLDFIQNNSNLLKQDGMWFSKQFKRDSALSSQRKNIQTKLIGIKEEPSQNLNSKKATLQLKRKSLNELYQELDRINHGYTKVKGFMDKNRDIFGDNQDYFQSLQNPQKPEQHIQPPRKQISTSYSTKRKVLFAKVQDSLDMNLSAQGSQRQNMTSIYDEKKSQSQQNDFALKNNLNLSSILDCQRLQTPQLRVHTQKRLMTSQQDRRELKQDNQSINSPLYKFQTLNNSLNDPLQLLQATSTQPLVRKINLKKQYVPRNMGQLSKMLKTKQLSSQVSPNNNSYIKSTFAFSPNLKLSFKNNQPQQKLVSIIYPLTDYAIGVEERSIHKELIGDKLLLNKQEKSKANDPEQLLEGMSDYFVLSTHSTKESQNTSSYTPQKHNGWRMITKAIFNKQAPQHKIFNDNLKRYSEESDLSMGSSRVQMSKMRKRLNMQGNMHNDDNKENAGFLEKNAQNKKLISYMKKTKEKLSSLNEMKQQLDSLKVNKKWYENVSNPIKQIVKTEETHRNTITSIDDKYSDEELNESQNQKIILQTLKQQKIKEMIDRFYKSTTQAFEAKKQDKKRSD